MNPHFHRVSHGSIFNDAHLCLRYHAHVQKMLPESSLPFNIGYHGSLADI